MPKFPHYPQYDAMDCGAACLRMIAKYYGKNYSLETLREKTYITREGVSLLGISDAAEKMGFKTVGVKVGFEQLCQAPLPCIVHWRQEHFVVVYEIGAKARRRESAKARKHESAKARRHEREKARRHEGEKARKGESEIEKDEVTNSRFRAFAPSCIKVADPAQGLITYSVEEFLKGWLSTKKEDTDEGVALLFEPTPEFYNIEDEKPDKTKFKFILKYLRPYRKLILQLFLGMLIGTGLQLIFPFLTQSIVDYGIGNNNLSFIIVILIAQLTLYTAQTAVEFIRSWILLHITTRINISIISDFLIKLMKLPLGFFDTKMIGDLMQRIGDHHRIQNFLTSSTINTLFSLVSFVVFTIVLAFYNLKLLAVFMVASALYVLWITIFLKKRRELDMKRFAQASSEQSTLYQLITGMQEIKLNNCEKQKRWEWENIQAKLFRVSIKGLALSQYQQSGAFFINETKNILISFFAAYSVIKGEMTLGMMMAVQYIIGQLNSPINQVIGFIQSAQDAKISLERLGEIHNREEEGEGTNARRHEGTKARSDEGTKARMHEGANGRREEGTKEGERRNVREEEEAQREEEGQREEEIQKDKEGVSDSRFRAFVPSRFHPFDAFVPSRLFLSALSFRYNPLSPEVLKDINLTIPQGKITAIVGMSGSGKTTLVKLLLGFYPPTNGEIRIGGTLLQDITPREWRAQCGAVMQDGFIFSDTIAKNIAVGVEYIDRAQLLHAVQVANIQDLVEGLPLGFNTKIGQEGMGISQGQKQRILIARAVYKNPEYLFFDEATNALDANNERVIMENLGAFFKGKTVVVVAHRLSTVKNADNIVVLDKGCIIEQGTHGELTAKRGAYFELVRNQLELGG